MDINELNLDGCTFLAAGILEQAINDYKLALRGKYKKPKGVPYDDCNTLEEFFLSDFGQDLSNNNGELIIQRCKDEIAEGKIGRRNRSVTAHNDTFIKGVGRNNKPIRCIETGEVFPSSTVAAIKYKRSSSTIQNAAIGKQKTAGGFHWEYVENKK